MLRQIEWRIQNGPIIKNGVLPVTTLFFRKFCFSLRTLVKDFLWFTNCPNIHIHTFRKRWSFIWGCFFAVSILNTLLSMLTVHFVTRWIHVNGAFMYVAWPEKRNCGVFLSNSGRIYFIFSRCTRLISLYVFNLRNLFDEYYWFITCYLFDLSKDWKWCCGPLFLTFEFFNFKATNFVCNFIWNHIYHFTPNTQSYFPSFCQWFSIFQV